MIKQSSNSRQRELANHDQAKIYDRSKKVKEEEQEVEKEPEMQEIIRSEFGSIKLDSFEEYSLI